MHRRPRSTETPDAFSEFLAEHPGLWPQRNPHGDSADPFSEFAAEAEPVDDRWLTVARGRHITAKVHDYRHAVAVASLFLSFFTPAGIISTAIVGRQLTVTPLQSERSSLPPLPASLAAASPGPLIGVPAVDVPAPPLEARPPATDRNAAQRAAAESISAPAPISRATLQPVARAAGQRSSTPLLPLTSALLSPASGSEVKTAPPPLSSSGSQVNLPVAPSSGSPVVAPPPAPPAVSSTPPSARVAAPPPAPEPPPAARPAAPGTAAEGAAVRAVLDRYRMAFSRLDAGGAKAVWPGVDERALSRAFNQLEEQQFVFDSCGIDVSGARATASCRGRTQYIPKVGSRSLRVDLRQWTFTLTRIGGDWTIDSVDTR
jgi:hypothetical protein